MIEPPASRPQRIPRSWTLCSSDGALDVEVVAEDGERLSSVLPVLARELGVSVPALWSGSSRLPDELPLSSPELAHGAVLGLGRPGPRSRSGERSSALELHVVGGPEAGRTVPLDQGRHLLGRGADATLRLDDPDVSRRHAQISVGAGRITVTDLGSTNGTRLEGRELGGEPEVWPSGAVLRVGASAVTVRGPEGAAASVEQGPGGRARLRPSPRLLGARDEVAVEFPRPPTAPPRRRLAWIAIALPALGGIAMAWLLHTPQFLFFALLSPVVALGTWLSERWWGRRDGRRATTAHVLALSEAQTRLADAVRADRRAAETAWPDLATLTTAARRRSSRLWERRRADPDALQIRVGTGRGPTGVTRVQPDGERVRELADDLPAVVDLRTCGGLAVTGPRARTTGVLAAAVGQLAVLHGPDELQLALVTDADALQDWLWLRWLPHLGSTDVAPRRPIGGADAPDERLLGWVAAAVAARRAVLAEHAPGSGAPGRLPWLVVVVDRPVDPRVAAALRAARDVGVAVLTSAPTAEQLPVAADAEVRLSGETGDRATLCRAGSPGNSSVVVDRLPRPAAAALARDLAGLAPSSAAAALPREVRLLDLSGEGPGLDDGRRLTGRWSRSRDSLVATIGRTADGPVRIDLCRHGPHALVAGTTGSGKSELLQAWIAGLAMHHPPDRCTFLLVDYKGGAAFAEAVALPHTVGLVTDLDQQSTERALRSLGAELTRRESLLAEHGVADVSALPDAVDLARLVIVVDEFATLAEEHPSFVGGLVGIAQRGRSLGVHLVLATQRPGGVVSPEIRANCSLRICLRTTDEADSRDVLGTSQAAFLPVDLPGRAFLRTGSAAPAEVQIARVSVAAPASGAEPLARRWSWPYDGRSPRPPASSSAESDLARLAGALQRHASESGSGSPHRPWQPPLPTQLDAADLDLVRTTPLPDDTRLRIGLVDRPDVQTQEPLELDLGAAGGWLAVGGARSGRTTLLRTVLAEAVCRRSPEDLHVHVLDHGGGALAAEAARLPHAGTTIGAEDPLRTVRLLDRLAEEVAARRAGSGWPATPALLLLVDGVESLSTQLDEADPARGSAALLRLVRDGAAVGLTSVLTADRAVPGGRLAAAVDRRLVLPLPDRADYAVAGIPTRAVPDARPPGRALLGEAAVECQLAMPRPMTGVRGEPAHALRIVELLPDPELPLPQHAAPDAAARSVLSVAIGPGGDEGAPLTVDLHRTGGLLVLGPPGSGRSSALRAFGAHLAHAGAAVVGIGVQSGAGDDDATGIRRLDVREPARTADELADWLAATAGRPRVVIVDDLALLADSPVLTGLPAPGPGEPVVLLTAGQAADVARYYQGPLAALRRSRSGLLLNPGPGDADVLGIRLPRTPVPVRPGSGWLVVGGTAERVQVARRRVPA
ncbi:FtsK/SpoIIIE domain-containing protein [Geodermatophilus sp. URMC 64]